jgi:hypothetical protein
VAATLIFSTLLLANLTLFVAANQFERQSLTANSESLLADTATVLGGTKALSLLDNLQSFLSSRTFQCTSALQDFWNYTSSLSASGNEDGVSVNETLTPGQDFSKDDNFSILKPFNGSYAGAINVNLVVRWSGVSPLRDVTYSKAEIHHLHLPVGLDLMTAFCNVSVGLVRTLLENQTYAACDYPALEPSLGVLENALQSQASVKGLAFSLEYQVESSHRCLVNFVCIVEQLDVAGPAGAFNVRVEQDETESLRVAG